MNKEDCAEKILSYLKDCRFFLHNLDPEEAMIQR